MAKPIGTEAHRQYRVARQTLAIHAALRDRFRRRATGAELLLMAASLLFGITAVAPSSALAGLGLDPRAMTFILGIASLVALTTSLTLMLVDWRGQAFMHAQAADKWSSLVQEYRRKREPNGDWSTEDQVYLSDLYWHTDSLTAAIPTRLFGRCKAKYLRRTETSALQSAYPACPRILILLAVTLRDGRRFWSGFSAKRRHGKVEAKDE